MTSKQVKRFNVYSDSGYNGRVELDTDGKFVNYEDYKTLRIAYVQLQLKQSKWGHDTKLEMYRELANLIEL